MLLNTLPPELIRHILAFLSSKELVNIVRVCKDIAAVTDTILRARFWAAVVDRCAGQALIFEASRPSDYRISYRHLLTFSTFVPARVHHKAFIDDTSLHSVFDATRCAPIAISRARFLFPPLARSRESSVFFTLDEGEHFQTFLIQLLIRAGPFGPPTLGSEVPQNARTTMRYRVGSGLNYTVESQSLQPSSPPAASTSSSTGQTNHGVDLAANVPFTTTKSQLRSDVSIVDGLERVWRDWFEVPLVPTGLASELHSRALNAEASGSPDHPTFPREERRPTSIRTLESDGLMTTITTFPSIPYIAGSSTSNAVRLAMAQLVSLPQGWETPRWEPMDGQRLFEMAWQDLECDIGRVMVALEDAEHAQSRAVVLFSSTSQGMVPVTA